MEPQGTPPQAPQQTPPQQPDDYETASRSTADYINSLEPIKKEKKQRRTKRLVLIVIVVLALLGAGGYFVLGRSKKSETPAQSSTDQTQQSPASTVDSELSEHHVSQDLFLAIDYPKTWDKNTETPGQLKLQSPNANITDEDGTKKDAKVTITIVPTGSTLTGFTGTSTSATAATDSIKLTYKQPSQSQRKDTYLSFLSFGESTGANILYITGDFGYKKDQDIMKTDIAKGDPIINVSFVGCDGGACGQPLAISPEAWGSDEILKVAQSILESLAFQ